MNKNAYLDFTRRLTLLMRKRPELIATTLSNIFTMRLIGNKTHGDLAEIAITTFINQYMYDFQSTHVGKDLYRAKSQEEDITITNSLTNEIFPISLKAYGDGPLQLSTDKHYKMYPMLSQFGNTINSRNQIRRIFMSGAFAHFRSINVLSLIYDEPNERCNVMIFNFDAAQKATTRIEKLEPRAQRRHPVYRFYDSSGNYICEVRYGDAAANALQRGLWTNSKHAKPYFTSLSGGWVNYSQNDTLVRLISHAMIASVPGHQSALEQIDRDILRLRASHAND